MQFSLILSNEFAYIHTNNEIVMQLGAKLVPLRIGHSYRPVRIIPLEKLYTSFRKHKRLRVFANKGLQCEYCPKRGIYLIEGVDKGGATHIDLYTEDFELMTIDHVLPRSKGGLSTLENLVPCCSSCNLKKGNKIL